jgi:predicted acylesterase/phospholipase RssA
MRVLCVLLLTLVATGCVFSPRMHYDIQSSAKSAPQVTGEDDRLVGIALSGGGSRAALFAAAGMEALWEHGLLDSTDYISSVSGGSIAASYFFKTRAMDEAPLDGEFFDRFKTEMRHDFYSSMEWRQCYKVRWLSSTRRSSSLKEVLDQRFLEGLTLGELGGKTPRLLINATVYDSGRRFVFTTMGTDEVGFDFASVEGVAEELADWPAIRAVTFADDQVLGAVPVDFPVSLAVAASAAVPLVMGPVTIQLDSTYLHLGDGGLFDNSGTETLEQGQAQ